MRKLFFVIVIIFFYPWFFYMHIGIGYLDVENHVSKFVGITMSGQATLSHELQLSFQLKTSSQSYNVYSLLMYILFSIMMIIGLLYLCFMQFTTSLVTNQISITCLVRSFIITVDQSVIGARPNKNTIIFKSYKLGSTLCKRLK